MCVEQAIITMARTGVGGDVYMAVIALIGDGSKVVKPVAQASAGADPLPIQIMTMPTACVMTFTMSAVYEVYL